MSNQATVFQLMKYQQHIKAIVNIATNIYTKIQYLALKISDYNYAVDNNKEQLSITEIHHDIEANNQLIEDISETIHYLTQQQREIIIHNFNLKSYIKENITPS